jgi:hypothetical protein
MGLNALIQLPRRQLMDFLPYSTGLPPMSLTLLSIRSELCRLIQIYVRHSHKIRDG